MRNKVLLIVLVQVLAARGAEKVIINNSPLMKEKPDWLQTCPRAEPNKDDCFQRLFMGMFPALSKGVPEIGVEPFEPLRIDGVSVQRGMGGLALAGGFKDLKVSGPSNATVKRAGLDLQAKTLEFDLVIPKLKIDSRYNLKGNILLLPLVGDGETKLTLKNVRTTVTTKLSFRKIEGREILHIDHMKVTFLVGGMRIHLTNLFNGNEILGASLNLFLNQNAMEVISELRSDLESGLADIFQGLWNNVFSKIPFDLWLV